MEFPIIPSNESARQLILDSYHIVDSPFEKEYDDIAMIAAHICETPVCFVSLIDHNRQWLKSSYGMPDEEIPRQFSFCAHAINEKNDFMMVPDLRMDKRFEDNPLVANEPHVVFYASAQLITPEGFVIGTLCVMDAEARILNEKQQESLKALARQVMAQLNLRKKNYELTACTSSLETANEELKRFAHVVAHDLKSPIHGIRAEADNNLKSKTGLDKETIKSLELIRNRSIGMEQLVNGMLQYARAGGMSIENDLINMEEVIQSTLMMVNLPESISIRTSGNVSSFETDEVLFKQILLNLINNAIKYNDKPEGNIHITAIEKENGICVSVSDNGPGIPEKQRDSVFEIFKTLGKTDRYGNKGTGIGLATVKRIAAKLNATISIDPEYKDGACFTIVLPATAKIEKVEEIKEVQTA